LLGMYRNFNKIYGYNICSFNEKIGYKGQCTPNLDSYLLDPLTGLTGRCSAISNVPRGDFRDKLTFICSMNTNLLGVLLAIIIPIVVGICLCTTAGVVIYRKCKNRNG